MVNQMVNWSLLKCKLIFATVILNKREGIVSKQYLLFLTFIPLYSIANSLTDSIKKRGDHCNFFFKKGSCFFSDNAGISVFINLYMRDGTYPRVWLLNHFVLFPLAWFYHILHRCKLFFWYSCWFILLTNILLMTYAAT